MQLHPSVISDELLCLKPARGKNAINADCASGLQALRPGYLPQRQV